MRERRNSGAPIRARVPIKGPPRASRNGRLPRCPPRRPLNVYRDARTDRARGTDATDVVCALRTRYIILFTMGHVINREDEILAFGVRYTSYLIYKISFREATITNAVIVITFH